MDLCEISYWDFCLKSVKDQIWLTSDGNTRCVHDNPSTFQIVDSSMLRSTTIQKINYCYFFMEAVPVLYVVDCNICSSSVQMELTVATVIMQMFHNCTVYLHCPVSHLVLIPCSFWTFLMIYIEAKLKSHGTKVFPLR